MRGNLFVGVDGQLGQPGEDNAVTYGGTNFEIEFIDDANKGFFYASRVTFNRGASTAADPVSAAGEIFAETQITNNAYVELTQPLIINENLRVESDGLAITSSGALTLRDDFNVGSAEPSSRVRPPSPSMDKPTPDQRILQRLTATTAGTGGRQRLTETANKT